MSGRLSSVVLRLVTVLLVFVIVATVGSFPSVISQTLTTITNVSTATNVVSTNVYSTQAVRVVTVTVNSTNTFWSGTATVVQGAGDWCYYKSYNVTISPGTTEVIGTIGPARSPFNFYIMNPKQFQDFDSESLGQMPGEECGRYFGDSMVKKEQFTAPYSFSWKNPPAGFYYLIFWDPSGSSGTLRIPVVIGAIISKGSVSTSYTVLANSVTLTSIRTLTSLQVNPVSSGMGSINSLPILIGAVVIVLIVVGFFYFRSRRMKK